jgi:hypothetical protein
VTNPFKRTLKALLDGVVVPLVQYVQYKVPATNVIRELERRTAAECADYVQARMPAALHFERRKDLWDHAIGRMQAGGLMAEFGVWNGQSINHIARRVAPLVVHGFDSFEGLREDWSGWTETKGTFDLGGRLPKVEPNVQLVRGWFDRTVPAFLADNAAPFSLIHVDSDTFEAAATVLGLVGQRIQAGTVIVFDEYLGYRGWRIGEYRAWQECVRQHGIEYEYLAFSAQAVSLRVVRR